MRNAKIKFRDMQFPRRFFSQIDLDNALCQKILSLDVEISASGESNQSSLRDDGVIVNNPSSLTMFLFSSLWAATRRHVPEPIHQDKLGLGLLKTAYDYVHYDLRDEQLSGPIAYVHCDLSEPATIVNFDKMRAVSFIVRDIIEPLTERLKKPPVMYIPCNFTDACRVAETYEELRHQYQFKSSPKEIEMPLLVVNSSLENKAAIFSHVLIRVLEYNLGTEKTRVVVKNILLGEESILNKMILVLKTLHGEPLFVLEFLDYLRLYCDFGDDEYLASVKAQSKLIDADKYLSKIAGDNYTPGTQSQWSQWSMLMGLIEKQLEPTRGSMWPTSTTMKPFDEKLKQMQRKKLKEKGKKHLNFEELLEVCRDLYQHKAIEPGKILETVMREKGDRVW